VIFTIPRTTIVLAHHGVMTIVELIWGADPVVVTSMHAVREALRRARVTPTILEPDHAVCFVFLPFRVLVTAPACTWKLIATILLDETVLIEGFLLVAAASGIVSPLQVRLEAVRRSVRPKPNGPQPRMLCAAGAREPRRESKFPVRRNGELARGVPSTLPRRDIKGHV
jgi:hypothetical protein